MCVYIYIYTHTHIHIYILFHIFFLNRLLQNIEYSPLSYAVGPCWLSVLYIVVYIYESQTPNLSLSWLSPLVTISLFSMSVGLFVYLCFEYKFICIIFIFRFHV